MDKRKLMPFWDRVYTEYPIPYKYVIKKGEQFLYYFGSAHTYNPDDPQLTQIKNFFTEFIKETNRKNCIVLYEGGERPVPSSEKEGVLKGGEMDFVIYLAHQAGIQSRTAEIPEPLKLNKLAEYFSKEDIFYYNVALVTRQWHQMTQKPDYEDYVSRYITADKKNTGWDFDFSLDHAKQIHKKLFKTEFNEKDEQFFQKIVDPTLDDTIINKISRFEDEGLRDVYIMEQIEKEWNLGKNIFVIYGCTHAIVQEPALRTLAEAK